MNYKSIVAGLLAALKTNCYRPGPLFTILRDVGRSEESVPAKALDLTGAKNEKELCDKYAKAEKALKYRQARFEALGAEIKKIDKGFPRKEGNSWFIQASLAENKRHLENMLRYLAWRFEEQKKAMSAAGGASRPGSQAGKR